MSGFGAVEVKSKLKSERFDAMTETVESLTEKYQKANEENQNIRTFFKELFMETRKPHYGDHAKSVINSLLTRAQEAGVYEPPEIK